VTEQSAVLVADAVEPVRLLAGDLGALADSVAVGLDGTQDLLATTQATLDEIGLAARTNLADMADAGADVADRLARVLERIEALIPGDTQSVAEELRALADGLQPVADQLRALGLRLETAADQLGTTNSSLDDLAERIGAISGDIDELGPTFDRLGLAAANLRDRAGEAADRLGLDLWLLRILALVGGAVLAVIGIVIERLSHVAPAAAGQRLDDAGTD
jgi:hypothetical protein